MTLQFSTVKKNIFTCSDGANQLPVQNKLNKGVLLTSCQ